MSDLSTLLSQVDTSSLDSEPSVRRPGRLSSRIDTGRAQNLVQRYRPQLDGNYNSNSVFRDKQDTRARVETMLEHGDFASGMEYSDTLQIRVPGARYLSPQRETQQVNSRALSKGKGGGGNISFGKPRNVTRKDLYRLRGNAAKAVSTMRKMGFNGTIHGFGYRPNKTDHDDGNAVDFMVPVGSPVGNKIARYFIANRKQHGVKYVIWKQRIASASSGWKWRRMEDRGSPTANHMDHPHVSFY